MQIYNENELRELVEKLNASYSDFAEWKFTKARKEHKDEVGDKIAEGEYYFKRQHGPAWDDVLKLSRDSMEKMLFCIFDGNFRLQRYCEDLVEEKRKKLYENHLKHSPARHLVLRWPSRNSK